MKRPEPPDPLASVTREQWVELWAKLRLHTWKRYRWLHERLGEDLDDVAHQAILDTMRGTRRWPPIDARDGGVRGDVSLFSFLCEVVRSNVSHIWERERRKVSVDAPGLANDREESEQKFIDSVLNASAKKYPHLVGRDDGESRVIYNLVTGRMLELVAADAEVHAIMKLWREEPDMKPSEVAVKLGFEMPRMRAAQKRLRRLLKGSDGGAGNG